MRNQNLNPRKVKIMDENVRTFGYCADCASKITDKDEAYYCTEDGLIFCDVNCVLSYYQIEKIEV